MLMYVGLSNSKVIYNVKDFGIVYYVDLTQLEIASAWCYNVLVIRSILIVHY